MKRVATFLNSHGSSKTIDLQFLSPMFIFKPFSKFIKFSNDCIEKLNVDSQKRSEATDDVILTHDRIRKIFEN